MSYLLPLRRLEFFHLAGMYVTTSYFVEVSTVCNFTLVCVIRSHRSGQKYSAMTAATKKAGLNCST